MRSTLLIVLLLKMVPQLLANEFFLHNNIDPSINWPPQKSIPPIPPYLDTKPSVININTGRQLFIDDFLIEKTDLERRCYQATPYIGNPILSPEKEWEKDPKGGSEYAMPFSDGVWYDFDEKIFKMWYMCGYLEATCMAISNDGLTWTRPLLDIVPGTNIINPSNRDSTLIWPDYNERDPQKKYKMFRFQKSPERAYFYQYSKDGIHWPNINLKRLGETYDRSTAYYDPFRNKWVLSLRGWLKRKNGTDYRIRRFIENSNPEQIPFWNGGNDPQLWVSGRWYSNYPQLEKTEIYNMDVIAYESLLIGLFSLLAPFDPPTDPSRPKNNQLYMAFSRDGHHWYLPTHLPIAPLGQKKNDWNWGNIQSVGGGVLIVKDQVYLYYSGRKNNPTKAKGEIGAVGVGFLRRDGFCSMSEIEQTKISESILITPPVTFDGEYLFVNANIPKKAKLKIEVLDENMTPVSGFKASITGDSTYHFVKWGNKKKLTSFKNKNIRFKFTLKRGDLYSFWVSKDIDGKSNGYVGAGGPLFKGPIDN